MAKFESYEATLPSCWASALVNGDRTGMTDEDEKELDRVLELNPEWALPVGCEEAGFCWHHDATPYGVLAAAAIGLLPAWARLPLRLPYAPILEGTAGRLAGTVLVGGIRWALSANPPETAASAPAPEAPAPLN